MKKTALAIIGSSFGHGGKNDSTRKAPRYLQEQFKVFEKLQEAGFSVSWVEAASLEAREFPPGKETGKNYPSVLSHNRSLADQVYNALNRGAFPLVLGGDHSCGIGTWSGVVDGLQAAKKFGLVWMDAHMDAHTPKTSPSQNYHGMPLSILLGEDEGALGNLRFQGRKISPEHLVLMGARSWEKGEQNLLNRLGVKVFSMEDMKRQGLFSVFQEALSIASRETKGFGLSLDLDVFDPSQAPGVGTPVVDGLKFQDIKPLLPLFFKSPNLKGFEIAEFNPDLDQDHKTAQMILEILDVFGKTFQARAC